MLKTLFSVTALTAALLLTTEPTSAATPISGSHIRFAHFAPGTSAITLTLNDNPSHIQAVNFGNITSWHDLPPGTYDFATTGVDADVRGTFSITGGQWMTLALIGTTERDSLEVRVIDEDFSALPYGESRLRLFHGIEDLPALDVVANDTLLVQYMTYPNGQDGYASVDVVASAYRLYFTYERLDPVQYEAGSVDLLPGYSHFVAFIGTRDAPTFAFASTNIAQALTNAHPPALIDPGEMVGGEAHLRVAHFASGTTGIDIYINGQASALRDVTFAHMSDFLAIPDGPQIVSIVAAGESVETPLLPPIALDLERDTWTTIALIGAVENGSLQAQPFAENITGIGVDEVRVGVFQAIPGIAPVDVRIGTPGVTSVEPVTTLRLLGYPASQGDNDGYESFDLPGGTYDLEIVSAADDETVIVTLDNTTFVANRSYLIATLRADPPYYLGFTELEGTVPAPEVAE